MKAEKALEGALADCIVLDVPKRLLFCSRGLFKVNTELGFPPFPVISAGGGPAGVVDVAKLNPVFGLLAGVDVSVWPEENALTPGFPKEAPVMEDPPSILGACV